MLLFLLVISSSFFTIFAKGYDCDNISKAEQDVTIYISA